tara:strand:+ start:2925 stop:3242 length:318 start_codon:yes stop_codon:yes gene_type:complete
MDTRQDLKKDLEELGIEVENKTIFEVIDQIFVKYCVVIESFTLPCEENIFLFGASIHLPCNHFMRDVSQCTIEIPCSHTFTRHEQLHQAIELAIESLRIIKEDLS